MQTLKYLNDDSMTKKNYCTIKEFLNIKIMHFYFSLYDKTYSVVFHEHLTQLWNMMLCNI